uniref:Uncharacterized protein n=1 Tax=Arundo donax TaxID=35708 RepID=A0A0A9C9H7_ARUDO
MGPTCRRGEPGMENFKYVVSQ